MIVAQYSVHAIAGLKPDYGIHFPNIRSPEGGQIKTKKPAFPERLPNRRCTHSAILKTSVVDVYADFGVFTFSAYLTDFLLL
jgi:hypothetical protein